MPIHIINDGTKAVEVECSGSIDCRFCMRSKTRKFQKFLDTILFPSRRVKIIRWVKKKGKKKKIVVGRELRPPKDVPNNEIVDRTIKYICSAWCDYGWSPCYLCIKKKCADWQKAPEYKGKEPGCPAQYEIFCLNFICCKDIVDPPEIERS